jgi:hypothetical protein
MVALFWGVPPVLYKPVNDPKPICRKMVLGAAGEIATVKA